MNQANHFFIENDLATPLCIALEPEGAIHALRPGETLTVRETFNMSPSTLQLSTLKDGGLVLAIWTGDGEVSAKIGESDLRDFPWE
ncbi:MAG: hypothetical protein NTW19_06745 [Planctomycetota bacterium]|nr:hypothetical protein [Planctomycetota bacterium]